MYVLSISNKTADSNIRGRLTIKEEDMGDVLHSISGRAGSDTVIVCTCNRTEIYGEGDVDTATDELASYSGTDASVIRDHCLVYTDEKAIEHLYRVCAGLDSMVIGEDEILGQVRSSCRIAKEAGTYNNSFPQIFQGAFEAAKKVKTNTVLSKTSVSVATLAAAYCHKSMPGQKKILMIGAGGETGSSLRKNLLSYGDCDITATVHRTHFDERNIHITDYKDRYHDIGDYDIIISATKSPHYTVTRTRFMEQDPPVKKRLFVDLAVPSDIDPEMASVPEATLVTIDDFRQIARENNERKATAVGAAEQILDEERETLMKELYVKKALPQIPELVSEYGNGFRKFFFDYKKKSGAQEFREFVDTVAKM